MGARTLTGTLAIAIGLFGAASASASAAYPKAVRGIWMSDSEAGQAQCRRFLTNQKSGQNVKSELSGAEIIRKQRWQSYTQHGASNTYSPVGVDAVGEQEWRVFARLGSDFLMQASIVPQAVNFTMRLDQGKLAWVIEHPQNSWGKRHYFRCAAVPKKLNVR